MGRPSQVPLEQHEEAVLRLLRKKEPVEALSRRFQVSEQTLYRWRDKFLAGERARLAGRDRQSEVAEQRIARLEKEVARRAQVIGELLIANEIFKNADVPRLSEELRAMVRHEVAQCLPVLLKQVVRAVAWPTSSFFHQPKAERKRPGPAARPLDPERRAKVKAVALEYPWWGYKRLAVVCRRLGLKVSNRFVYRVLKAEDLLRKPQPRKAELYQAARLSELLPEVPDLLWQADVTYIRIPGCGWW